jgi:hypothetical protein
MIASYRTPPALSSPGLGLDLLYLGVMAWSNPLEEWSDL